MIEAFIAAKNIDALCLTKHWLANKEAELFELYDYNPSSCFCRTENVGGSTILSEESLKINCLNFIVKMSIENCIELLENLKIYLITV